MRLVCAIVLCLCCVPLSQGQSSVQAKHANLELLSTQTRVGSEELLLGVHFTLEKGWHIYWINPGDSGQPPSFNWILPAGAAAGEIQWPRPFRMQNSPTIADYGYHDEVLLMVPVHWSALPQAGSKSEIALDAKWLICREVCLADHTRLTLTLPISSGNKTNRASRLFAQAKALLPRPWPRQWKATAESRKDDFLLTLTTRKPLVNVEFFPLDPGLIDNAAKQRAEKTSTGAKLVLKKSDMLLKPVSELRGVLVIAGHAYQLRAPVVSQVALK